MRSLFDSLCVCVQCVTVCASVYMYILYVCVLFACLAFNVYIICVRVVCVSGIQVIMCVCVYTSTKYPGGKAIVRAPGARSSPFS
jgi:hypothetical protein